MKSAEEWFRENNVSRECFAILTHSDIKQIQLDAFKAGMTEAAEVVRARKLEKEGNTNRNVALEEAARDILSARDRKETI